MLKKVLITVLILFTTVFIIGCGKDNSKKLEAPSVMIQENVITWSKVDSAVSYELHIGDKVYKLSETTYSVDGLKEGEYAVKVKAISGDKNFKDSDFSSELVYRIEKNVIRLDAPVIKLEDNQLTWDQIENATYYEVYIGVDKHIVNSTSYTINDESLTGSTSIFVIAGTTMANCKNSQASNIIKWSRNAGAENLNTVFFDYDGIYNLESTFGNVISMVNERQLYDSGLWSRFVEQYRHNADGDGYGWRGEFWGKMMEGAVITYKATKDKKLYKVLENTVEDLLTTQQANGSFSTYGDVSKGNSQEFEGWDVWCRVWSLTGLMYFHDICQDQALKSRIYVAVTRHLDYICEHIGDGEGKININDSASQWGGLPASTILEVVCKIYNLAKKQEYLDLATHIVKNGGSKFGDQIEQAIAAKTLPYTWGAPKAGELCLFFDGVLEYYYITGIEKYKTAAVNFWYLVQESEITIVGGGCTKDECFEHSVWEQSDPTKSHAMQEFCVTIHWLNFTKDIYQLVKDPAIMDSAEVTIYNAVLCAVDNECAYDHAFGSYNNLIYSVRSKSAAGGMSLSIPYNWAYGCCISQGSIATGLIPLYQFAHDNDSLYMNMFFPGNNTLKTPGGKELKIAVDTNYPVSGNIKVQLELAEAEEFNYVVRIPAWSKTSTIKVNGVEQSNVKAGEYYPINKVWNTGDEIEIIFDLRIEEIYGSKECSNENSQYNVALKRGPITLARDARLDNGEIFDTVEFVRDENGEVAYTLSNTATFENIIEIETTLTGGKKIHLVNYGNAGKTFSQESMFTTYMPTTDYWKIQIGDGKKVILVNNYYGGSMITDPTDGLIHTSYAISDYSDLNKFAVELIQNELGYYYIKHVETGKYLTVVNQGASYFKYMDFTGANTQQFKLSHAGLMNFKIQAKNTNYIISANNEIDAIWLYSDCASDKQFWSIMSLD